MSKPRIFVSYALVDATRRDYQFAMRLVDDLRAAGADVVMDGIDVTDDDYELRFNEVLATYQWLVFVQTPEALHSLRVQMAVNSALKLVTQKRMRGVIPVIATPCERQEVPPTWAVLKSCDASQDYPRALARVLLALGLLGSADASPPSASWTEATSLLENKHDKGDLSDRPIPLPTRPPLMLRSRRLWLALSMVTIAFVVIFATIVVVSKSFFGGSPAPTATTMTSIVNHANVTATANAYTAATVLAQANASATANVQVTATTIAHANATTTTVANAHANATAQVNATATAITIARVQAQANATARAQAQPTSHIRTLGRISNLSGYCQSIGDSSAFLGGNAAYDWRCVTTNGQHVGISMTAACRWQYNDPQAEDRLVNYFDPYSWECFTDAQRLGKVSNLSGYCQSIGDSSAFLGGNAAYDWHCVTTNGQHVGISMTAACRWQYNDPQAEDRLVNYFDPYSWECWD